MKMEIALLAGAESKKFLLDLTKLVERMEKAASGKKAAAKPEAEEEEESIDGVSEEVEEALDEDVPSEDLESFDDVETADEDEVEEAPPKKAKKTEAKAVHAAALAKMGVLNKKKAGTGKAAILAVLKKFKASKVDDIKESDRAKVIAAINALKV